MSQDSQHPSQLSSALSSLQGAACTAVGSVASDPSWTEEGEALKSRGEEETKEAREREKTEGARERLEGKVESWSSLPPFPAPAKLIVESDRAYGYVTGDQEHINQGNVKAEKGEWKSSVLGEGEVPGMKSPNRLKAEKAEWTKG
ncbi:hypothetical protein JCM8547_000642 [Rhodosporidiobolus lusitaniae]